MWKRPWGFKEAIAVGVGLIIVGLLLQLTVGAIDWGLFAWPANIILALIYILLLITAFIIRKQVYAIRFLMTWQMAVAAIAFAVVLTVVMGLTRQVSGSSKPLDALGLTKMLSFWPFCLVYIWMSAIVGLTAINQICNFSWHRLPSLLSHLGLFIVLVGGTLGSADMRRMKMYCEVGQPEWRVLDERQNVVELPIAIELRRFIMDEYPPQLMVIDNASGRALERKGKPLVLTADSSFRSGDIAEWHVKLLQRVSDDALEVAASSSLTGRKTGLVSCGSYMEPPQMIALSDRYSLAMPQREPRRYASDVEVMTKSGRHFTATVEVNRPLTVDGWKIYQYSYNTQMGKWSTYSVLEFVSDPWLPVAYTGIALLAAGAVGMFFSIPRRRKPSIDKLK